MDYTYTHTHTNISMERSPSRLATNGGTTTIITTTTATIGSLYTHIYIYVWSTVHTAAPPPFPGICQINAIADDVLYLLTTRPRAPVTQTDFENNNYTQKKNKNNNK